MAGVPEIHYHCAFSGKSSPIKQQTWAHPASEIAGLAARSFKTAAAG
jgi:hypothetical protein